MSQDGTVTMLFVTLSCSNLEQTTKTLATCVGKLSDEQIWQRSGPYENAAGNLILYLGGNMRQWILHGVGGVPDVRARDLEFTTQGGINGAKLIADFEALLLEACGVMANAPGRRMAERITPQGRDVSVMEAISQVVGHVQMHVGQVKLLTKQMLATDLDLTMPRQR